MISAVALMTTPPSWWPARYAIDGETLTLLWFHYDVRADAYTTRISQLAIADDFWGSSLVLLDGPKPDSQTILEVLADLDSKRRLQVEVDELATLWNRRAA